MIKYSITADSPEALQNSIAMVERMFKGDVANLYFETEGGGIMIRRDPCSCSMPNPNLESSETARVIDLI